MDPCVWVCKGDFCLLPPGFYHCNTVHTSFLLHIHTHRFFIIGSWRIILFRLINNFLQLKSGLETCLSLHAIHSPSPSTTLSSSLPSPCHLLPLSHDTDPSFFLPLCHSLPSLLHWLSQHAPFALCRPHPRPSPSSSTTICISLCSALLVNQENSQQQRKGLGWSSRSENASKTYCLERIRQGLGTAHQCCHAINRAQLWIYIQLIGRQSLSLNIKQKMHH